ncbi:MAG: GNAT family N-acetyltransferase, partial [Chitinophagaceae bacterium]
MPDSTIRKVSADEVVALQEISQTTFREAFAAHNTAENMRVYLEQNLSVDTLLRELSHPQSSFYFFMDGPVIAGYLKLNWE